MDASDSLRLALADRYTIERELGQGGMATVYLAEDLKHHRPVALKVLKPELSAALGPERFLREIELSARLTHPHILPLHDSGTANGILYYVMPYVEGESLRDRLTREKQLPLDDALQIAREVADGLSYAHAHGVVHRDIKPENILLESGHAVVADFGIARAIDAAGGTRLTETGVALGTPAYMSPEQAAGSKDLDGRSDLYALGCVLYEMLAGEPPFTGSTAESVVRQHLAVEPPNVTRVRPAVPAAVAAALQRALAKTPADRFNPVALFAEALGTRVSAGVPAPPAPSATVSVRRRRRVPLAAGIAAAVVALAAVGLILWHARGGGAKTVDVREPILVLPFDTRVTSPGLKDVGQLAADRIESAIEEAALGAVKPRRAALGATGEGGATPEMLSRIARSSGAATLVTGVIYQRGDTVEVQSQVLRARDLKTVFSLRAAQGLAGNAGRVVDEAKERILGAVGYYVSPESRGMDPSLYTPPSTLALFRLWTRANQLFNQGKFVEAIPVQQEILRRDSTQFYVAEQLAGALFNLGRSHESDSILRVMETRRGRLTRGETLVLDISQSLRASPEDEWRAATAAFQVDSQAFAYLALYAAVRTNHLSQATRFYHLRDTSSSWGRDWQAWYSVEAAALHGLGRYDQELALAREARTRDPGNSDHAFTEARALLALGRMAELEQVLTASRALPDYRAPGTLMHLVAAELLEHRTKAEYQRMFERALAWNQALPADRRQDRQVRQEMAVENYYLGRYAEAARLFADLGREFPDEPLYVNSAARIAASQGDTAAALRRIEELRADTLRNNGLEVSRIFALLGRKVEAVAALRDYLNRGGRYDLGWHATDLELIALRDYPPFVALVALKE